MWWLVLVLAVVAALAVVRPWREGRRRKRLALARRSFHVQRERLECHFFQKVARSGKPRGLRWVDCDFENGVTYACDRRSGELSALVGVTIRFEAVEGGEMEFVKAVGNLRAATAVFRFDGKAWQTDGRAIFNLNPTEAIEHFRDSNITSLPPDHFMKVENGPGGARPGGELNGIDVGRQRCVAHGQEVSGRLPIRAIVLSVLFDEHR
jgi:hypothetical protein